MPVNIKREAPKDVMADRNYTNIVTNYSNGDVRVPYNNNTIITSNGAAMQGQYMNYPHPPPPYPNISMSATVNYRPPVTGNAINPLDTQPVPALPAVIEGQLDYTSAKGVFGWACVDNVNIPYLVRDDKQYVSVKMVEQKLLSQFPSGLFPDELKNKPPLLSHHLTFWEIRLMNEINIEHCNYEYGRETFTEKDLIVKLSEFEDFYTFVKGVFKKNKTPPLPVPLQLPPQVNTPPTHFQAPVSQQMQTAIQTPTNPREFVQSPQPSSHHPHQPLHVHAQRQSPQQISQTQPSQVLSPMVVSDYYGWVQVNNTVLPYVIRNGITLVPLMIVRHAAGLLHGIKVNPELTGQDHTPLNILCTTAGVNFNFKQHTKLIPLRVVLTNTTPLPRVIQLPKINPFVHAMHLQDPGEKNCAATTGPSNINSSISGNTNQAMQPFKSTPTQPTSSSVVAQFLQSAPSHRSTGPPNVTILQNGGYHSTTLAEATRRAAPPLTTTVQTSNQINRPPPLINFARPTINTEESVPKTMGPSNMDAFPLAATTNVRKVSDIVTQNQNSLTMVSSASIPLQTAIPAATLQIHLSSAQVIKPSSNTAQNGASNVTQNSTLPLDVRPTCTVVPICSAQAATETQSTTNTAQTGINQGPSWVKAEEVAGKWLAVLDNPDRIGKFIMLENIYKVVFPECTSMDEFQYVFEKELNIPAYHCDGEEEKAFIQFYGLPYSVLKCNTIVNKVDLVRFLPQLKYMFKDKEKKKDRQLLLSNPDVICIAGSNRNNNNSVLENETSRKRALSGEKQVPGNKKSKGLEDTINSLKAKKASLESELEIIAERRKSPDVVVTPQVPIVTTQVPNEGGENQTETNNSSSEEDLVICLD